MSGHAVCRRGIEVITGKERMGLLTGHNVSFKEQTDTVSIFGYELHIMGDHEDRDTVALQLL